MHTSQNNIQDAHIATLKFIAWTSKLAKHKTKQTHHLYFGEQNVLSF
jgi:hypothetical protein